MRSTVPSPSLRESTPSSTPAR